MASLKVAAAVKIVAQRAQKGKRDAGVIRTVQRADDAAVTNATDRQATRTAAAERSAADIDGLDMP